jgi:hypothetical protein
MRSSDPTCGPLRPRLIREIDRAVVGLDQATAETSTGTTQSVRSAGPTPGTETCNEARRQRRMLRCTGLEQVRAACIRRPFEDVLIQRYPLPS